MPPSVLRCIVLAFDRQHSYGQNDVIRKFQRHFRLAVCTVKYAYTGKN